MGGLLRRNCVKISKTLFGLRRGVELFRLDPETVRYLDYDSEQAYFAGPSDATHAIAAVLLRHCAIAARTGPPPNPAALWAGQTLHAI